MNKTIPELKESLKSWGMKLLGNKQNLVDQLLGEEGNLKQAGEEEKMKGNEEVYAEALEQGNLMNKTIPELKALLKLRGMKLTGKKSKLVDQLLGEEVDNDADLELNSVSRLNEKLKTSNKPTHCNRAELIKRLRGEEQFEEGSFGDYDRATSQELIKKLKSQNRDIAEELEKTSSIVLLVRSHLCLKRDWQIQKIRPC